MIASRSGTHTEKDEAFASRHVVDRPTCCAASSSSFFAELKISPPYFLLSFFPHLFN